MDGNIFDMNNVLESELAWGGYVVYYYTVESRSTWPDVNLGEVGRHICGILVRLLLTASKEFTCLEILRLAL